MAKVTFQGTLPPDDPVYKTGPVVGGRRIGRTLKSTPVTQGDDSCPICGSREPCGHELAGWGEDGKLNPAALVGGTLYDNPLLEPFLEKIQVSAAESAINPYSPTSPGIFCLTH